VKRCVRPLFTERHAEACYVFSKIVQHLSQEETTRCIMILIFRPFLMRFSLSGILFSVLRRLEQQMGLKLFAQFLHKLSKQMSFQEYPVCDGHRQGPRLLSEFGIDCTVSQLNPAWLRGKMLAAFGNPSVTIAKHPADSFLHGVSSHRETANSEAKPWCCGGIPTLQIFPLAYRFQ